MTEGVDFSSTANADWGALAAAIVARCGVGAPVGVYLVDDKSPTGRGVTPGLYAALVIAGLKPFFIWEGNASWMLGGYNAGVVAAQNAQANLLELVPAGAPADAVIRFAHDIDPDPSQWQAIDACLNGAKSVLASWPRVGAYGGWLLIDYLAQGGNIKHLWQTSAWEYGRGVHSAADLYQYAYNQFIAGTNCDLVRSLKDDFGAALPTPKPQSKPTMQYAKPELPDWWADALKQSHPSDAKVGDVTWHAIRRRVEAVANTFRYSRPDIKSPKAGPPVKVRDRVNIERTFLDDAKVQWFVEDGGSFLRAQRFTPRVTIKAR